MSNFENLTMEFLDELGHTSLKNGSICLYDIKNDSETLDEIQRRIMKHTCNYRLIILNPKESHTNINILDIDL